MDDKVPNIRFSAAKAINLIIPKMSQENKLQAHEVLSKHAESDEDFDAKYYA